MTDEMKTPNQATASVVDLNTRVRRQITEKGIIKALHQGCLDAGWKITKDKIIGGKDTKTSFLKPLLEYLRKNGIAI